MKDVSIFKHLGVESAILTPIIFNMMLVGFFWYDLYVKFAQRLLGDDQHWVHVVAVVVVVLYVVCSGR